MEGKKDSRPAASASRWVLGPGLGWEGRAQAGRCCESEGMAAYDGQWRQRSGAEGRWRQTEGASCCGRDCWTCSPAAGTQWATVRLKEER